VSLFSFQDLITSISGIMIFVTLLLAVDVAARLGALPHPALNSDPDSLRREVTALQAALAAMPVSDDWNALESARRAVRDDQRRLQAEAALQRARAAAVAVEARLAEEEADAAGAGARLTEARAILRKLQEERDARGEIAFIPDKPDDRKALLLECDAARVRVGILGDAAPPREFAADRAGLAALASHVASFDRRTTAVVAMIKPSGAGYAMRLVNRWREQGIAVGFDALEENKSIRFQSGAPRGGSP
jgi:phage terminase Nu1 subunit (DNA packaging protein)